MNDLGKTIDSMVKETNPTGQIAKKPTDYKGVETTPYGHVYNFNGGSITDLGEERRKMNPKGFDANKKYGFSYTKGGDEVIADTFEEAYKGLGGVLEEPKPAAKDAKTEAKEAEAYYKEAGDIIGKNAIAGKDLLEGVDKDRFEAAKKVLSRNARGLGNIESQYIDLMNKGWKQQDVEAELAKRGFSKDDIEDAYGEVRYGERYKDWKGNDNYEEESGGIKGDLEKAGFGNVKVVDDKTLTFTGSDNKPWTIKQNESLGFDVYDSTGKKVVSDVNANRESIAKKISSLVKS